MTSRLFAMGLVVCAAMSAAAQPMTNFAGTWVLNTARSQNLGMMADLQVTSTLTQTPAELVIHERASLSGDQRNRDLHYDLTGKPTTNEGPMGDRNDTIARWQGPTLIVTWTGEGAVAGTKVVRTETRSLSADGKTMTVETVRGSNAPLVMVYEKQ